MMRAQRNDENKYPQESMIKQKSNSQSNAQTVIVSKKVGFKKRNLTNLLMCSVYISFSIG